MMSFALKSFLALDCIAGILISLYVVDTHNDLQASYAEVNSAKEAVGVQLQSRVSLIPNLVKTVKEYPNYEAGAFKEVTESFTRMQNANNIVEKNNADGQLTTALEHFFTESENYPDLKEDKKFQDLMIKLKESEDRVVTAKKDYNEVKNNYNLKLSVFPNNLVASMFVMEKENTF